MVCSLHLRPQGKKTKTLADFMQFKGPTGGSMSFQTNWTVALWTVGGLKVTVMKDLLVNVRHGRRAIDWTP